MFYKIRNILFMVLSFVLVAIGAKAQGLVSLSEEAMFEDELDTVTEAPKTNTENKPTAPTEVSVAEVPLVAPNAPASAPKVIPKGPMAPSVASQPSTMTNSQAPVAKASSSSTEGKGLFGSSNGLEPVEDDLFEQMSDIEKRTALLNLELRREKLQNEIEAVKNQRKQALIEEQEKAEALRLKNLEAEKEVERKLVVEQEKLRELDIQFETLRQEKILASYKNKMLEENQKWIANNANFYKQIADLRKSNKDLVDDANAKMQALQKAAEDAHQAHLARVEDYKKEIKDHEAQINILRSRISTLEKEREETRRNPFAGFDKRQLAEAAGIDLSKINMAEASTEATGSNSSVSIEPVDTDLSKLYAVTEIRGQGGELIAKLINKGGTSFYVKKGTSLQSGHIITEITTTYVKAENGTDKHYLYFAAGGILPTETAGFSIGEQSTDSTKKKSGPISSRL